MFPGFRSIAYFRNNEIKNGGKFFLFFLKMGQTRPLFVYLRSINMTNISPLQKLPNHYQKFVYDNGSCQRGHM